jgi:diguanylate cyclase (GGDEF)-like protein
VQGLSGPFGFGYFTTALLAAAAVALASGLQFLVIGLRQRRESMYLSYAMLCLCIATLALANTLLDVSTSMQQATLALRVMCGAAVLAFPALVVFVGTYTGKSVSRPVLLIVCALAAWFFALNLASPYGMLDTSLRRGAPTVLFWGETLFTVDGTRSIWGHAFYWLSYVAFFWTIYRAARQYLDGQKMSGLLLALCLLIQFSALLWGGIVVDTLGYPYPHLDVFAFLSFVLLMGLSLSTQLRLHTLQLERTALELRAEAETRRQAELNLRHAAYHDALTGLPNRPRALYTLADMLVDAAQSGQFGAVLMIDLDNFKTINDSLGHHVGDRVLEAIADSLLSAAPTDSTVARLGGDEFVILLGALANNAEEAAVVAMKAAEDLVERLSAPLAIDSRMLGIGASIGVAVFPDHDARATDIVRCADIAMYRAKVAGRNAARLFLPHMQHDADDRLELERGLRTALENQELSLHFQPHVSMNGKLVGAEALLRWQHPTLGSVPPATFIPIAEETGLIHTLGTWVIAQACACIQSWRERGVDFGGRLSVNVSPWQIAHPQFAQRIEAQVREANVDPSWLTLELTESALLNDFDAALGTLHALSTIGFRLALDDFGTGYSSLAYLQQLPLDELKIDRTFINALQPSEPDPLAGFIIDVGRRLGMTTIAEGVETAQHRAMLESLGCDILQGYLICRPLPEDDFLAWLDEHAGATAVAPSAA